MQHIRAAGCGAVQPGMAGHIMPAGAVGFQLVHHGRAVERHMGQPLYRQQQQCAGAGEALQLGQPAVLLGLAQVRQHRQAQHQVELSAVQRVPHGDKVGRWQGGAAILHMRRLAAHAGHGRALPYQIAGQPAHAAAPIQNRGKR